MKPKRLVTWFGVVSLVYFFANHTWSHAAIVGAISGEDCPMQLTEKAQESVASLFGEVTANPWIYCLNGPTADLDVEYGTTRFAPLFPSIIVLGPHGQNADVISHEYVHAELAERTSVLLRTYRIPTWFDEGLAMQVDTRAEYNIDALDAMIRKFPLESLRLEALSTPSEFFGQGDKSMVHYAFSRCVLESAIAEMRIEKILRIASDVGWASVFPTSEFKPMEEVCKRL